MSSNDLRVHFGLGSNTLADQVTIRWPSGQIQYLTGVAADQILTVTEPSLALGTPPLLGTASALILTVQGDEGLPGAMALALGSAPGTPLGDGRLIPMNLDRIALFCLTPGNPILPLSTGLLDNQGRLQSPFYIPAHPPLIGQSVVASAVTGDPSFFAGVRTILSPEIVITFQ
jgi:hypothetical protein